MLKNVGEATVPRLFHGSNASGTFKSKPRKKMFFYCLHTATKGDFLLQKLEFAIFTHLYTPSRPDSRHTPTASPTNMPHTQRPHTTSILLHAPYTPIPPPKTRPTPYSPPRTFTLHQAPTHPQRHQQTRPHTTSILLHSPYTPTPPPTNTPAQCTPPSPITPHPPRYARAML